ncbi:hypothetical protein P3G55_12340 [Leptospira sp. 96542]|nr:hypothetical protein [Leptospira sp. 96542]
MKTTHHLLFFIFALFLFSEPIFAESVDPILYEKVKEVLSNTRHAEEPIVLRERLETLTPDPLFYLIHLLNSKDSYVFVKARAIRVMELYSTESTTKTLESTIGNSSENAHIRKVAIQSYSKVLKDNPNKRTNFLKKFVQDKTIGKFTKDSLLEIDRNSRPIPQNNKERLNLKRQERR